MVIRFYYIYVKWYWTIEKAREFQRNIYFCFIDCAKAFDCVDHNKLWKILRDGNTRSPELPLEKPIWLLTENDETEEVKSQMDSH